MKRHVKLILIVVVAIILLVAIIVFTLFEFKEVPQLKKGESYDVELSDLGGLDLFSGMVKTYFGNDNFTYKNVDDFQYLNGLENTLLVIIERRIVLDSLAKFQVSDFISRGNEVLLIAKHINVSGAENLNTTVDFFADDSSLDLIWKDGTNFKYEPYYSGITLLSDQGVAFFEIDSIGDSEPALFLDDSLCLFQVSRLDSQKIYAHSAPVLFQNRGAQSEAYLENFNKTFQYFESKKVLLHQFTQAFMNAEGSSRSGSGRGSNKGSLLQYILSQRALKYAYYLILLAGLLYVLFASKRKQREIPIEEESKNTSLDYVETASSLFMAQNQNGKLVKHMKRNFLYKVKMTYFLNADDPLFEEKLAKKSKCPKDEISSIMHQLNLTETHSFNDDQLIRLFNDINLFDKNRK